MKDSDDFFRGLCALASIGLAITAIVSPDPVPWLLGAILVYMWGRKE
jgi:hypothetical protein